MKDGTKSCLGFTFLILGLILAVVSLFAGGVGELVTFLGGDSLGINLKVGLYIAIGVFVVLFAAAIAMFVSVRDWAWIPAILGGVYAILPDLMVGPQDDIFAVIGGVLLSAALNYFTQRRSGNTAAARPERVDLFKD